MEMVRLKNGAEEVDVIVRSVMISLDAILESNPIGFYELVKKARNPKYVMCRLVSDYVKKESINADIDLV